MAAITRTSRETLSLLPTGRTSRSCSTRKSLACISSGNSPISSRKIVPPFAAWKTGFGLKRAGKCAFIVAKKLAFHQRRHQRAAIHRDKGHLRERSAKVNRARHQFFARSALAHDQNRCSLIFQSGNHPQHILNICRRAHDSVELRLGFDALAQKSILGDQTHFFRHALKQQAQLLHAKRLLDIVVSALLMASTADSIEPYPVMIATSVRGDFA